MNITVTRISIILGIFFLCCCAGMIYPMAYVNASEDFLDLNDIYMIKGDLYTIKGDGIKQVSVSNPDVSDIADADDNHILLTALDVGQTVIFVWDKTGKRTFMVYVYSHDLDLVKDRLKHLLKAADINGVSLKVNQQEGKVVATGDVPEDKMSDYDKILGLNGLGESVLNLVKKKKKDDLIEIDVEVTQLDTTLAKELGFEWPMTQFQYEEQLPIFDGSVGDFFKIGDFRRTTNLLTVVHALLKEGRAKILSNPKVVVKDGEQATFLVGGEVPISTTSFNENGFVASEKVTYKSYGVSLSIQPQLIDDKSKIDLTLSVEISDIAGDYKAGDDVAFTTQNADTKLCLKDKQTIVLAGLIKNYKSKITTKVPFLSSVPVLGALFRYKGQTAPDKCSEIVIALTPTILTKKHIGGNAGGSHRAFVGGRKRGMGHAGKRLRNYYKGIPPEMVSYVNAIQDKIAQAIVYPPKALERGWEGEVDLNMHLLQDGTLAFALIDKSSGYDVFDDNALRTAKNLAPYDKFPSNTAMKEIDVSIPIVYSLHHY